MLELIRGLSLCNFIFKDFLLIFMCVAQVSLLSRWTSKYLTEFTIGIIFSLRNTGGLSFGWRVDPDLKIKPFHQLPTSIIEDLWLLASRVIVHYLWKRCTAELSDPQIVDQYKVIYKKKLLKKNITRNYKIV